MDHRTKKWAGRLATGLGLVALLALAGCYATTGRGAYYSAGYETPPQTVYYAPAQAQVQVQQPNAYYVEQPAQTTYYVQPQAAQPVYYAPQPAQPVYYAPQPAQPVYYNNGGGRNEEWERGRRRRPVVIQQGGGAPVQVEVRGGGHDHEHRSAVIVR